VRQRFGTNLAVAVTGIAGPQADGTSKPVGLTYVAVASDRNTSSRELRFTGDRLANRSQAAHEALAMLVAEARTLRQEKRRSA
jgi:nicotinamide mononucleotide (NMN) deamidase PncC